MRGLLWASAAFIVVALGLALRPRRAAGDEVGWVPLDERPSMPLAISIARVLSYDGPTPSLVGTVATTTLAVVAGWATTGVVGAAVVGAATLVALRLRRARAVLTLGGPLLFVG
ncbi:MAG TPA: hypothetical protein PLW10_12100, partial [Myxococcota bacterium]|nr:hypothetical protein [Myxococcota bacterium]